MSQASVLRKHRRAGVSRLFLFFFISQQDKSIWASEEADEALALLDLLLDLVAGRGDLGLCGEHGAEEREHGPPHGGVEGPAHGAQPGPVRSRVGPAVQLHLV